LSLLVLKYLKVIRTKAIYGLAGLIRDHHIHGYAPRCVWYILRGILR
jgi:hypothetical protein